ncbi:kinase-like protein [Dacryopinax primogenitus]|uniref:Kinase-like protein n=1 Tax=Dacryopinax primogenitus (strain DJM 731) TaxID=1858805 RepID=M5GF00_DACPD|nr:kinase-like protein [Dacryopinax primogenitus]EJU03708.1 kinase-like protein [Dacryopinax primogenitus]
MGVTYGVAYLHDNGIVHGDLRAVRRSVIVSILLSCSQQDNILVACDGQPQLANFGLSVVVDDVLPEQTTSTMFAGSVRWMPPERIQPSKFGLTEVSCRTFASDIHSLGMTLWEMFALRLPYHDEETNLNIRRAIIAGKRPSHPGKQAVSIGLTSELWAFIQKCWVEEPDQRPVLVEELNDVDNWLSNAKYGLATSSLQEASLSPSDPEEAVSGALCMLFHWSS